MEQVTLHKIAWQVSSYRPQHTNSAISSLYHSFFSHGHYQGITGILLLYLFLTSSAAFMMLLATLSSKPNSLLTSAAAFFRKPNARITGAYKVPTSIITGYIKTLCLIRARFNQGRTIWISYTTWWRKQKFLDQKTILTDHNNNDQNEKQPIDTLNLTYPVLFLLNWRKQ